MKLRSSTSSIAIFLLLSSSHAYADLPLTVENLLSDKGKMRFELSATYSNSERRGVDASNPLAIQTSPTTFVNVPTVVGENSSNTDVLILTSGIRYGLTSKDEIYSRISALGIDSRSESAIGDVFKDSRTQFADSWIGINHKFSDDVDSAALFGFAELQIAERQADGSKAKGKSLVIGATTYQTYDPIVLSLTGAIQLNDDKKVNGTDFKQGNSITLNPSVGFAVNDKVTLTTGVSWRMQEASERNGNKEGIRRTRTSLDFGLGYALGKKDTINFSVRPQVSGDGDVQMGVNWIHHLGKK